MFICTNQYGSNVSNQHDPFRTDHKDYDTQSKIPVLTTIFVFLFWCLNIESANDDSVEIFLGISLLISFVIYLRFTLLYLSQNQNEFKKSYFLALVPSVCIAFVLIMIANPLSWDGIDWVTMLFSMLISIGPALYFYFVKGRNRGTFYAIPSVLGLYFVLMIFRVAVVGF